MYSLGFLLFQSEFQKKNVWLLVSRLGGWLMARQEQQQRRNSKSSIAAASADDSTSSGSCSCSCLRPSLLWCLARAAVSSSSISVTILAPVQSFSCLAAAASVLHYYGVSPVRDPRFCSSQQAASTIQYSKLFWDI